MKKRSPGSKLLAVIFALLFTMIVNLAFVCFHFLNVFLQEDNFHAISKQVILNHQRPVSRTERSDPFRTVPSLRRRAARIALEPPVNLRGQAITIPPLGFSSRCP